MSEIINKENRKSSNGIFDFLFGLGGGKNDGKSEESISSVNDKAGKVESSKTNLLNDDDSIAINNGNTYNITYLIINLIIFNKYR